jgi:hypothetical protein
MSAIVSLTLIADDVRQIPQAARAGGGFFAARRRDRPRVRPMQRGYERRLRGSLRTHPVTLLFVAW